jgi:hypothetical protein
MSVVTQGLAAIVVKCGTTFYPACGTGTTAVAAGDTGLATEIVDSGFWAAGDAARHADATVTNPTTTSIKVAKTFTSTGSKAIAEVGVFSGATGANIWARKILSSVRSVVSGDTFTLNYTITFA